jgi:hypothetical protein
MLITDVLLCFDGQHPDGLPPRSPKDNVDGMKLEVEALYADLDELLDLAIQLRDALDVPIPRKPE